MSLKISHRKCVVEGCKRSAKYQPVLILRRTSKEVLQKMSRPLYVCEKHSKIFTWDDLVPEEFWKIICDRFKDQKPVKEFCEIQWVKGKLLTQKIEKQANKIK